MPLLYLWLCCTDSRNWRKEEGTKCYLTSLMCVTVCESLWASWCLQDLMRVNTHMPVCNSAVLWSSTDSIKGFRSINISLRLQDVNEHKDKDAKKMSNDLFKLAGRNIGLQLAHDISRNTVFKTLWCCLLLWLWWGSLFDKTVEHHALLKY